MSTDRGQRIASIAMAHAGCAAHLNRDLYIDIIVRPEDRGPAELAYYIDHPPSTCGLTAQGCYRLAGCPMPEFSESYVRKRLGRAISDIVAVAQRYGAWFSDVPHFSAGDVVLVNGPPFGEHVIICVSDSVGTADSQSLSIVQGGQVDGGIVRSNVTLTRNAAGKWCLGTRAMVGVAIADGMPVPDVRDTDPGGPFIPDDVT